MRQAVNPFLRGLWIILSGGQFVVRVVQKKITMGNSVKTDKEIQLDLGLVGSLSKVGVLGPFRSGPKSRDMICFQIRHVTRSPNLKLDSGLGLRFRSY